MKLNISPIVRVSFGLIMLTLSLLFASDWLGLIPHQKTLELEHRKKFSESMAIQFSSLAQANDARHIRTVLEAIVKRDADIESAAFRSLSGGGSVEVGDHAQYWTLDKDEKVSTADQIIVPIFQGDQRWGSVEVRFAGQKSGWLAAVNRNSFLALTLFVTASGFFLYLAFLRRVMRELDPSQVVPERVKAAFNSLAEGVLILDEEGRIVLANEAFSDDVAVDASSIIGTDAKGLNWSAYQTNSPVQKDRLPWMRVMQSGHNLMGEKLTLHKGSNLERSFTVNCTLIHDDKDNIRGVITTFDDLTELEKKNAALKETLTNLKKSQSDVNLKNLELQYLATRDPLTDCLNRRSFSERYKTMYQDAIEYQTDLVCLMVDIDHFKRVNDNYGHAVGDKVIKFVADVLRKQIRKDDLLGRYGGEEFCVVLERTSLDEAFVFAERMRTEISNGDPSKFTSALGVSASFGLACIHAEPNDREELVNKADRALYHAKESGRNKVMAWSPELFGGEREVALDTALASAAPDGEVGPETQETGTYLPANASNDPTNERLMQLQKIAEDKAQQLDHYVAYDRLTQLPERDLFIDRVEQALLQISRGSGVLAVISLGLDDLGRVNDTLGHESAEEYLQEAAERLTEVLRGSDTVSLLSETNMETTVSKLSEGVFGLLLPSVQDSDSIPWIVKRIFEALGEPLYIRDHNLNIGCHIGISISSTDGEDAVTLIKHASISRYYAEQQPGGNNVEYFSEEINRSSREQLHLESQMTDALEHGEFELLYQPKIDLRTGDISGFESLIRWNHPIRGLLTPNEFIDIAERTRLINLIGEWVLQQSCLQLIEFQKLCNRELTIAVNLSPVQFSQPDLVERTINILQETGVSPDKLELELTESCLMDNVDSAYQSLAELQSHDISISIDDFGTGYSGLSYLHKLPINTLKVDRSFVADIGRKEHNNAIVAAVINMAKALDMKVIAEGIETHKQLEVLTNMNCDEAQGYLFSRPVNASKAEALLAGEIQLENVV